MLRLSINKFTIFFLYQSNNEAHANLFSTFTPFQTIPIKTSPFKFYILLGVLRLIMNFPFLCMWCDDALCFNGFRANFYIYSSFSKKIRWFRLCKSLLKIQKMCISPSNEKWNEKDEEKKKMYTTSKDRLFLYHPKNGHKHAQRARDIVNKTIHNWLIHFIYNVNIQMELSIFFCLFFPQILFSFFFVI